MARAVYKQYVNLGKEHYHMLRVLADVTGRSMSDLVRQGIEVLFEVYVKRVDPCVAAKRVFRS